MENEIQVRENKKLRLLYLYDGLFTYIFAAILSGVFFGIIGYYWGYKTEEVKIQVTQNKSAKTRLISQLKTQTRKVTNETGCSGPGGSLIPPPTSYPVPQSSTINSWQTYNEGSFQFQYPRSWVPDTTGILGPGGGVYNPTVITYGGNGGGEKQYPQQLPISTCGTGSQTETAAQYVDAIQSNYLVPSNPVARAWSRKSVTINGISGEVYTIGGEGYAGAYLVLANGKTLVAFGPLDSYPSSNSTVNSIIATFKFTKYKTKV